MILAFHFIFCAYGFWLPNLRQAIRYVENNPIKAGKRPQAWKCITPHAPVH